MNVTLVSLGYDSKEIFFLKRPYDLSLNEKCWFDMEGVRVLDDSLIESLNSACAGTEIFFNGEKYIVEMYG